MIFRFEDNNDYEYLKFFSRILRKKRHPESFIVFFFVCFSCFFLFISKEVKPSLDCKMIKLLTFVSVITTFSLKLVVE